MEQKRFVFVKPFRNHCGEIVEGAELTLFRGFYYINGGMILPAYVKYIEEILNNENLKREYLKEIPIIYNKL